MDFRAVIDQLDRHHDYVMNWDGKVFLLELFRFVNNVLVDEVMAPVVMTFLDGYRRTATELERQTQTDRRLLNAFLPRTIKLDPSWGAELQDEPHDPPATPQEGFRAYINRQATWRFIQDLVDGKAILPQRESIGARTFAELPEDRAYDMFRSRLAGLNDTIRSTAAWKTLMNEVMNGPDAPPPTRYTARGSNLTV